MTGQTGTVRLALAIDPIAQLAADTAIAKAIKADKSVDAGQAALVATRFNGEVVALLCGKDYAANQFGRATFAKRQLGSTFKPIVYAAAIESSWTKRPVGNAGRFKPLATRLRMNNLHSFDS